MNPNNFEEKPIRLVSVTEQGKYVIHPDGAEFLSKIQKPLGVVSVAGLYRTGKSYLLNRMLLNKSSGFGVGSTVNACTKGLWCWGSPIKGTTPDGQKINVIIIDSQGIGALDEDQNHDTKIFTLAVLSASTFIYNSQGNIDENALQSLSLVVNLSKNIQINAHSEDQQVDPEQLAQYFPNFCWVVRDFALQLVNEKGDNLTSNEYLERALALQKGFSDDTEDKNRIRRLLTTFFKQRECITMVRPLVDEAKLQKLDKIDFKELRTEFIDQVLQLRRRILGRLNPKKFKGQILDGKMYLNTLNSYVSAINQGAVPNMQNAWSYMCQQKCNLTFEQCLNQLQKELRQIQQSIPHQTEQINSQCDKIEELTLKKYLQETKGMESEAKQMFIELKQKVKSMMKDIKKKNQAQSLTILKSYAFKNFHSIEKMMTSGQFTKYNDYIKQLNNLHLSLVQSGPNLPNKQMIFLQFIKKAAIQGAQLFLKNVQKSFQLKKNTYEQQKSHLSKQIDHLKTQLSKQISHKKQQLHQLDEQNTQLLSQLQFCKQEIDRIKESQQKKIKQHQTELKGKKQQHDKQMNSMLKQIKQVKQLLKEVQQQKYSVMKQMQTLKAVYDLKEQQFRDEIQQYKKKQGLNLEQMIKLRNDIQSKYEKIINDMQLKVSQFKRKNQILLKNKQQMGSKVDELETNVEQIAKASELRKLQFEAQTKKIEKNYKDKLEKQEENCKTLQKSLTQQRQRCQSLSITLEQYTSKSSQLTSQIQDQLKSQSAQFKKEKAVYEQKVNFLQMELKQTEQKNQTNIEFYETRISQLQKMNKQTSSKFSQQKLREVRQEYEEKLKTFQKEIEEEKYQLTSQLQNLQKQKRNIIFQLEVEKKSKNCEITKYTNIVSTIQNQLKVMKDSQVKTLQNTNSEYEAKVSKLEYRIKQLQMQLQTATQLISQNQSLQNERSQSAIMQLKNYYQLEKQRLQQKSLKEKEKYQKKIQQITQEYQDKLKEETNALEEQLQTLRQDSMNYQLETKDHIQNLEHQLDIKNKNYDSIEAQYCQIKKVLDKKEMDFVQKTQLLNQSLRQQKQSFQKKIEELSKEKTKMEKQLLTLTHQKEEITNISKSKDQKLSTQQNSITQLHLQIENIKLQHRRAQSEIQKIFMQKTISYERRIALSDQEKQFSTRKIEQLQRSQQNKYKVYEEKIQNLRLQIQENKKNYDQKRSKQISELQDKYERLKKSSKQIETSYSKKVSSIERQLAIEQEKCQNLETRLKQNKSSNVSLEQKLSSQITILKSTFNQQKQSFIMKVQQLRQNINQIQSQKQSQISQFEKEAILLKNKNAYLQESKQKVRKQTTQKIKKFEQLLAKAEKEKKQDKSTYENLYNDQIKKVEKKYQQELKQATSVYEKRQSEWEQRFKLIQVQNRRLSQKVASSSQFNSETSILQERRLNELQQNQKRLMKELQTIKNNQKSQSNDTFMLYDKQKAALKSKLTEKQEKLRLAEKLKQEYFYELEKEKAKTNVQKQSFAMKIQQLRQTVSKYERDLQKYQRQNEKLKVQKRASVGKIQLGRYSVNKSQFHHTQRSTLQQSMSFLNVSVTSSIKDNKEGRSFSKMNNKEYLRSYQMSKQGSQKLSEKNSQIMQGNKQNFKPILDEDTFFGNFE